MKRGMGRREVMRERRVESSGGAEGRDYQAGEELKEGQDSRAKGTRWECVHRLGIPGQVDQPRRA